MSYWRSCFWRVLWPIATKNRHQQPHGGGVFDSKNEKNRSLSSLRFFQTYYSAAWFFLKILLIITNRLFYFLTTNIAFFFFFLRRPALPCLGLVSKLLRGFFDLTLSKDAIKLELVNHLGNVVLTHSVPPFTGEAGARDGFALMVIFLRLWLHQSQVTIGKVTVLGWHPIFRSEHEGRSVLGGPSFEQRPGQEAAKIVESQSLLRSFQLKEAKVTAHLAAALHVAAWPSERRASPLNTTMKTCLRQHCKPSKLACRSYLCVLWWATANKHHNISHPKNCLISAV